MDGQKNKSAAIVLMSVLAIIWGSSFILMKYGLHNYTWQQVGALRMFASFAVVFPFVIRDFKKIPTDKWKYICAAGLLGNCIPAFLFPLAEQKISSSLAGMMNSFTPLFTFIVGVSFFHSVVNRNRVAGVLIGLIGALFLIFSKNTNETTTDYSYVLAVVLATLCYAMSVNILRHKLHEINPVLLTGFALMFAGVPSGIYLFSTDFIARTNFSFEITHSLVNGVDVPHYSAGISLTAILILSLLGTALSTVLFNKLLKISSALFASSVTYLIPVVATIIGYFYNEQFNIWQLVGLCFVLSGVYLINKTPAPKS